MWIKTLLGSIKAYGYIGLGLLVSGLLIAVRILTGQNSRLRQKVEMADAKIHHAKVVGQKKKENEAVFRGRTREIAREIEDKKSSDELSDPNKDW
jgi:hypothetical protein